MYNIHESLKHKYLLCWMALCTASWSRRQQHGGIDSWQRAVEVFSDDEIPSHLNKSPIVIVSTCILSNTPIAYMETRLFDPCRIEISIFQGELAQYL